jgi:hypothetical protein
VGDLLLAYVLSLYLCLSSSLIYHSYFVLRFCRNPCQSLYGHGSAVYLDRRHPRAAMVRASTRLPWGRLWLVFVPVRSWIPYSVCTIPNCDCRQCRTATTWAVATDSAWNEWHAGHLPASPDGGLSSFSQNGDAKADVDYTQHVDSIIRSTRVVICRVFTLLPRMSGVPAQMYY